MNRTIFPISKLGYGCYSLSGAYGQSLSQGQAEKLIWQAYSLGITYFDTAEQYRGTEELLGKAVAPFRKNISISTKVGPGSSGSSSLSKEHIITSCEGSLARLNTDYIDLYQVHYDNPQREVTEIIEALELLITQGKIRHYGIGHLPLDRTLEYLKLGNPKTVMAEMSPVAIQRYNELICHQDHFTGIVAFSVTARGLLTGKVNSETRFSPKDIRQIDSLFREPRLSSGLKVKDKLAEVGARYGMSPAQVAIAWVINMPGVLLALTGPTQEKHLKENYQAIHGNMDEACHREITDFVQEEAISVSRQLDQEANRILTQPLAKNPEKACDDLMFMAELLVSTQKVQYKTGVSLFMKLLQHKRSQELSLPYLEQIHEEVKTHLPHPKKCK